MITLIPLPDHPFYIWQALVQYASGVDGTWLVYRQNRKNSKYLDRFRRSGARVVVWDDWRTNRSYNPMMKPALVGQWLSANPTSEDVMVIDPDVIPTGKPLPAAKSGVIFGTNTDWYTGPDWLKSKEAWVLVCHHLGVHPSVAENYQGIGAQYIFKDIPGSFWLEVAERSVKVYEVLKKHPIDAQPWCAEMYATHILAANHRFEPLPAPEMDMVWANGPMSGWDEAGFFHDAGQQTPDPMHFHKGTYQISPFGKEIKVDQDSASSWYVELIKETEKKFPDIVW